MRVEIQIRNVKYIVCRLKFKEMEVKTKKANFKCSFRNTVIESQLLEIEIEFKLDRIWRPKLY